MGSPAEWEGQAIRQADILCANDINPGISAEQCTEDIVIEILVGQPAQHYFCRRASNRSRMPAGVHRDSFELLVSRIS